MATLREDYEVEVKRMRDIYGPDAELPSDPGAYGHGRRVADLNVPIETPPGKIAELARQTAEAAHMLAEARAQQRQTHAHLAKSEVAFAQVSEALVRAIHEHREGTPENVPYTGLR